MADAWIEDDPPSRARVVLGWLASVSGVAVLVVLAWWLAQVWRDDLPDPLAIHWGASGVADATATLDGTVEVTTWFGIAGVAVLAVVGAVLLRRPRLLRGWMTGLASVAALAPASLVLTLLPNRGVATWQEAAINGWHLALVVVLPAACAAVAWIVAARPARLRAVGPRIAPGAPMASSRQTLTERQVLRGLPWVAVATVALVVWLGVAVDGALIVLGVPLAAAVLWLSVYRYRVTDEGLTLLFGPVGPLRRVVPAAEIEGATVVELRPSDWGGWGYRTSGRDWAVVAGRGPGCRVALAGRRSLSLTSASADELAGRVNAAVTRHWGA